MSDSIWERIVPTTTLDPRYNPGDKVQLGVHDRVMDLFHKTWRTDPPDDKNLALASTFAVVAQFREAYDDYVAKVLHDNNNPSAISQVKASMDAFAAAFAATEVYIYDSVSGLWPKDYRRMDAANLAKFGIGGGGVSLADAGSGFYSMLYVKGTPGQAGASYILASRGTDDPKDYISNAEQNFGLPARQYSQGLAVAKAITHAVDATHGRIIFAGHSLGGGIASLQGLAMRRPAFTFQAAGLSTATMLFNGVEFVDPGSYVTTFDYPGDWLDDVQTLGLLASLPVGRKVTLSTIALPAGAKNDTSGDRHLMNFVVPAMLQMLKAGAWPH